MEITKTYTVDGKDINFIVELEGSTIKSLSIEKFDIETLYDPEEDRIYFERIPYAEKLYLLTEDDFRKVHPKYELSKIVTLYKINQLRQELRDLETLLTFD